MTARPSPNLGSLIRLNFDCLRETVSYLRANEQLLLCRVSRFFLNHIETYHVERPIYRLMYGNPAYETSDRPQTLHALRDICRAAQEHEITNFFHSCNVPLGWWDNASISEDSPVGSGRATPEALMTFSDSEHLESINETQHVQFGVYEAQLANHSAPKKVALLANFRLCPYDFGPGGPSLDRNHHPIRNNPRQLLSEHSQFFLQRPDERFPLGGISLGREHGETQSVLHVYSYPVRDADLIHPLAQIAIAVFAREPERISALIFPCVNEHKPMLTELGFLQTGKSHEMILPRHTFRIDRYPEASRIVALFSERQPRGSILPHCVVPACDWTRSPSGSTRKNWPLVNISPEELLEYFHHTRTVTCIPVYRQFTFPPVSEEGSPSEESNFDFETL